MGVQLRHRIAQRRVTSHRGNVANNSFDPGQLRGQLGPDGLDFGLIHGADDRHGAIHIGVELGQLLLGRTDDFEIFQHGFRTGQTFVRFLAHQNRIHLARHEDDHRRQQRRSQQFHS